MINSSVLQILAQLLVALPFHTAASVVPFRPVFSTIPRLKEDSYVFVEYFRSISLKNLRNND